MSKKNARLNAKVGMGYAGGALQFVDDEHACYVHGNALRVFKVGAPPGSPEIDFLRQELDRLRQRSFPSFAHAARNRLAVPPDELI